MIKLAAASFAVLLLALPANAKPAAQGGLPTCDQRYLHTCWGDWKYEMKGTAIHHRRAFQGRKSSHNHQRINYREPRIHQDGWHSGIVTVQTAAGVPITVASHLAGKFQGFIADLVARGYHPRHIGSFARGGHVRGSRHYAGAAIDVDQRAWGKTARPMYHVADLAAKWGLRDGCNFRHPDCGHIDDGESLGVASRHGRVRVAHR